MTNERRLSKVRLLVTRSDHVRQIENSDYTVHWPAPNGERQVATIDKGTGEVISYSHVSGSVCEEVHPKGWLGKIDRRIRYLMDMARKEEK